MSQKFPQYVITGHDKAGKRFTIKTDTPQHYNIWRGNIWKVNVSGRRKLIKRIS